VGTKKVEKSAPLRSGWHISIDSAIPPLLLADFIHPAIRSVPPAMARLLLPCWISIVPQLGSPAETSQWTVTDRGLEISLAAAGRRDHDVALELLVCLGQALWDKLTGDRRKAYFRLLDAEIAAGISGEIDEAALREKEALLSNPTSAASRRRLENYALASFAGTAAEYVHAFWHDVTIRTGPAFLPAPQLRIRLEVLSVWFPPRRGRHLFPPAEASASRGGTRRGQ
jgi:hypothetical protein